MRSKVEGFKEKMKNVKIGCLLALIAICMAQTGFGEEEEIASLSDAVTGGKPSLNARLRYEHGDMDGRDDSDAFTLRTRLGYTTAPYKDFHAMIEFENVSALAGMDDYNQAGTNTGAGGRTVIADVEGSELNRAFLAYQANDFLIKAGRQRIILDNARFIGNVGWRQNEQTFDAVSVKNTGIDDWILYYGYISRVNRIFGEDNGSGPAGAAANAARFDSNAHVLNISYKPFPAWGIVGYAYLLDLGDGAVAKANSSNTYGLDFKGSRGLNEKVELLYELAYANQSDNSATTSGVSYTAGYYKADLAGKIAKHTVGTGYEVLGSDDSISFKTPLATGHKFNGWADVFLVTPPEGLSDLYIYAGTKFPHDVSAKVFYHTFSSADGDIDYGTEFDIVVAKKLRKNLKCIAKYANYAGDSNAANPNPSDIQRFSIEMNYSF